jgi:hypothetical protein
VRCTMSQSLCGARCANPRAVHGVPIPVRLLTPPASPGSFHSTSNMVQARRGEDDAMSPDVEATKDYAFFHSPKFKICFLSMWCVASMEMKLKVYGT